MAVAAKSTVRRYTQTARLRQRLIDQRRETAAIALALRALTRELRSASDWPRTPTAVPASSPQFFHPPTIPKPVKPHQLRGRHICRRATSGRRVLLELAATYGESLIARVCRHVARYLVAQHTRLTRRVTDRPCLSTRRSLPRSSASLTHTVRHLSLVSVDTLLATS